MTIYNQAHYSSELRLAILLLAAGEGSRLGSHPKALLKKEGASLIRHFCLAMQTLRPVEFVVVSGFHADEIEAELNQIMADTAISLKVSRNQRASEGQMSSIRLGLEALKSQFDVLLVALSDQPEIGAKEIVALLEEFSMRSEGQEIILPMVRKERGNPVLFSIKAIVDILSAPKTACRQYMDAHPEQVRLMATLNEAYVMDVDTLEDIQKHGLTLN